MGYGTHLLRYNGVFLLVTLVKNEANQSWNEKYTLTFVKAGRSRKIFEVSYLMVWYLGSIEHLPPVDLLGTTDASVGGAKVSLLLILSAAGMMLAWVATKRKLQT